MARDVSIQQRWLSVEADVITINHMAKDCVAVLELVSLVKIFDVVSYPVQLFDDASASWVRLAIHKVGHKSCAIVRPHDFGNADCHCDGSGDADFVDF